MELSESINHSELQLDRNKVNLYFNKYKFKATAKLRGIQHFRYCSTVDQFNTRLTDLVYPDIIDNKNFYPLAIQTKITIQALLQKTRDDCYEKISNFIKWREYSSIFKSEFKLVINYGKVHVYSNNLDIIQELPKNNISIDTYYVNQIANYHQDSMYQKNPTHRYRVYFNFSRFSLSELAEFKQFLYSHNFSLSRSLENSINSPRLISVFNWARPSNSSVFITMQQHYVAFTDEGLITVLGLTYPNLIRKLYKIEKK